MNSRIDQAKQDVGRIEGQLSAINKNIYETKKNMAENDRSYQELAKKYDEYEESSNKKDVIVFEKERQYYWKFKEAIIKNGLTGELNQLIINYQMSNVMSLYQESKKEITGRPSKRRFDNDTLINAAENWISQTTDAAKLNKKIKKDYGKRRTFKGIRVDIMESVKGKIENNSMQARQNNSSLSSKKEEVLQEETELYYRMFIQMNQKLGPKLPKSDMEDIKTKFETFERAVKDRNDAIDKADDLTDPLNSLNVQSEQLERNLARYKTEQVQLRAELAVKKNVINYMMILPSAIRGADAVRNIVMDSDAIKNYRKTIEALNEEKTRMEQERMHLMNRANDHVFDIVQKVGESFARLAVHPKSGLPIGINEKLDIHSKEDISYFHECLAKYTDRNELFDALSSIGIKLKLNKVDGFMTELKTIVDGGITEADYDAIWAKADELQGQVTKLSERIKEDERFLVRMRGQVLEERPFVISKNSR